MAESFVSLVFCENFAARGTSRDRKKLRGTVRKSYVIFPFATANFIRKITYT